MYKELISAIAHSLDGKGIPYMVIGGQAVLIHGEPRLTRDIDVTLGIGPEGMDLVLEAVEELGLEALPEDVRAFVRRTMVLPARHAPSGMRVDFIFSFTPYERQAIERASVVDIKGTPVRFASAEDLVIHKLFARRPRDLEDARGIILKNPSLDRDYVRGWLEEFDASLPGSGLVALFESL